jgi:hypothetical protein
MMEHSVDILQELKQISPFLSDMKKINVFSVPQGYFTNLDKQILENIFTLPTSLLTSEHHILGVPEGYFDNLAGNILNKIKSLPQRDEENLEHLPLLHSVRKENVFTVPGNYFTQLPATVLARVQSPKGKVVGFKTRSVWNYAVAATITGLMAISSLLVVNNTSNLTTGEVAKSSLPAYIKDSYQYKSEADINEGISNLSKEDIIKYLEATASDADDDAFASGIKEQGLPAQEDYLQNEKTLETYLNQN